MRIPRFLTAALLVAGGTGQLTPAAAGPGGGGGTLVSLTPDEVAGLQFMREEEKVARDVYLSLRDLSPRGPVDPSAMALDRDGRVAIADLTRAQRFLSALKGMEAECLIGVDLNAERTYKRPENIVDVLLNTFDITLTNATKVQTEKADLLITPDLSRFNLVDTNQVEALIEQGYQEASTVLREYFAVG